jgi:ornithine cyclodeaminase/alanine dehydrogenase-like protein (mu-crystallin family)
MRLFSRSDVERLLDYPSCIAAVEEAFRLRASGGPTPSAVLGVHVPGGGFHVKAAAGRMRGRLLFAAKMNANFPGNPAAHGLPTIQGVLGLFDAERGVPLALMDSMSVTTIRTASATAVAAKHLAAPRASTMAIIGCGVQAPAHVAAIGAVRSLARIAAFDIDAGAAARFAGRVKAVHGITATAASSIAEAFRDADIVITCTPSRTPLLDSSFVNPGAFVGAVGADNEHKHEIAPAMMAASAVVVDDIDQCATIGDLHHALDAEVMTRADVRATLGDAILHPTRVRRAANDVVVFDSTGVALEDVAAAAIVLERATPAEGVEFAIA